MHSQCPVIMASKRAASSGPRSYIHAAVFVHTLRLAVKTKIYLSKCLQGRGEAQRIGEGICKKSVQRDKGVRYIFALSVIIIQAEHAFGWGNPELRTVEVAE